MEQKTMRATMQMDAKMLILLTDVDGVFNKHPSEEGAKVS